jgi:nucleoside-diphosphate-sugar epimerase
MRAAIEDLEWRPTVSLAHGLQRAIDWLRGRLRDQWKWLGSADGE